MCWAAVLIVALLLPKIAASAVVAKKACDKSKACSEKGDFDAAIAVLAGDIRLDPKSAKAYRKRGFASLEQGEKHAVADYNRGLACKGKGDFDKAVADLDALIRLSLQSPWYYEIRGARRIRSGDYEGGIVDLQTAIRLDPNDPAAKFETSPKQSLTRAAIHHGEEQVRHMLRDRPAMAQFGDKAAVLHQWAARKFAGEDLQQEILWDASEPVSSDAANQPPIAENPGCIRIRRTYGDGVNTGKEQSFEVCRSREIRQSGGVPTKSVGDDEEERHEG